MSVIDATVEIEINGEKHKMLFNMLAIHHFRQIAGKEIRDLFIDTVNNEGNVSMVDVSMLLWAGIHMHKTSNGKAPPYETFAESITPADMMDDGVQNSLTMALRMAMPMPSNNDDVSETVSDESTESE